MNDVFMVQIVHAVRYRLDYLHLLPEVQFHLPFVKKLK